MSLGVFKRAVAVLQNIADSTTAHTHTQKNTNNAHVEAAQAVERHERDAPAPALAQQLGCAQADVDAVDDDLEQPVARDDLDGAHQLRRHLDEVNERAVHALVFCWVVLVGFFGGFFFVCV